MDRVVENAFNEQFAKNSFVGYVPDNELSPDLQKKLKRINRLPNGLYETKFKIDRYKFDRTMKNELQNDDNILEKLFEDVATETGTSISIHMKSKSNSKLRNPLINVVGAVDNIELAKERILSIFENIKMRVVLKMDVSYKDHSHIIGRGGFSIQKVMDDSSSHIHFPDSNRISDIKKSNVVLICGSPCGVEQARCKIRSLLPLVVHFKIPYEFLKPSTADTFYTKSLRSIQQTYNVHISLRQSDNIDENYAAIFDGSRAGKYIAVSVRGANNDLDNLKKSLSALIYRLTENPYLTVQYALTIEITEIYHQLVGGVNHNNIKNITQMTNCQITFPDVEPTHRSLDFDNLNEIPVNKSTVIIKGSSFEAVHLAWKELIGYLPLVLTFDVAHDQHLDTSLLNNLKKQYKVAIFLKHKEKYNTVVIRGIEKNSKALFEVRKQLLKLEDAEIPICCDEHNFNSKLTSYVSLDENGNHALLRNDNSTNILNLINSNNSNMINGGNNLLNGISNNATNILNAKMIQNNIDSNNNLQSNLEKNFNLNSANFNTQSNIAPNLTTEQQIQNGLFNPNLFKAVLQEQYLLQQQMNPRMKSNQLNNSGTNLLNNTQTNNTLNLLENFNLGEEFSKFLLKQQQQNLLDNPLRNTHSVSDIPSLQSNQQIFNNANQNETLHQSIRKDHLTSSCSSPALHAMVMQHHHSPSSLLNNTNNYSLNNSNLNSTGNNTSSTSSGNATSSTANNSFNMNGLNSSPPANASFNSSLINNSQSPIMAPQSINWADQRRQLAYDECRYLALKNTYEKQDLNDGVRIPSSVWSGFGFSKSMTTDTIRNRMNEWNPAGAHFNTNAVVSKLTNGSCLEEEEITVNKMTNGTESNEFVWNNMLNQNNPQLNNIKQRPLIKQESEICSSTHPYSSNYLNNLINNNHSTNSHFGQNNQQNQLLSANNLGKNLFISTNDANNEETVAGDQSIDNSFIDVNNIDLYRVLIDYGLVKYIDNLKEYKVNFSQFLSLTEEDLDEMGYNFIGRKKLYSAIINLRKLLESDSDNNNYDKVNETKKQNKIKKLTTDLANKQQIAKTFSNSSLNDCTAQLNSASFTPTKNVDLTENLVLIDNATNQILDNDNQTNENTTNQNTTNEHNNQNDYTIDEITTEFKSTNLEDYEIRDDDDEQLDSKINNSEFKNENDFTLNNDLTNQEEESRSAKSSTTNESSIEELNAKSLDGSLTLSTTDNSDKNKMSNQEESTDDDDLIGKQSAQETAQA